MLKNFIIKDQYCFYPFLGPHTKKRRKYQKQFGKKKKKNVAVRKHVRAQKKKGLRRFKNAKIEI